MLKKLVNKVILIETLGHRTMNQNIWEHKTSNSPRLQSLSSKCRRQIHLLKYDSTTSGINQS